MQLFFVTVAQNTNPDFRWSNSCYFNMDIGDSVRFNDARIYLLGLNHQYTTLKVDEDTICIRVARRSPPVLVGGIQLFVADNKNVAALTPGDNVHGLLRKDALICVSRVKDRWLETDHFIFPVSYNHGFLWRGDEDSYLFSLTRSDDTQDFISYPGIGIDLSDARGKEKHWLLAIEKSTVVWVEKQDDNSVCILLESDESPGIYYVYDKLFSKTLEVRKGQKIDKGELVGTAWGDEKWGHLLLAVVYAESAPDYLHRYDNILNFFPQLFALYYHESFIISNYFTKGKIEFGRSAEYNGNTKNTSAFEEYLGKGWNPCLWNTAEKLEYVSKGQEGNVRLAKTLFKDTPAECKNPNSYCDYLINVRNGVYRIRARVGDVEQASWQKIIFENVEDGTYSMAAGEQKWTSEKVVKVEDSKLTVRIYFDEKGNKVAGLSELVFQQVY